jgi:hypothetical protein
LRHNQKKVFDSGNFVKDLFNLMKFIVTELSETEPHFVGSSSVDHFFMDGGDELADSAYLFDGELKYPKGIFDEGIEILVPKGTKPTWSELKSLIN